MPNETRIMVPFEPQQGTTHEILAAIQMANEQHQQRIQDALAAQQQAANAPEIQARSQWYQAMAQKENQPQLGWFQDQSGKPFLGTLHEGQVYGADNKPVEGALPYQADRPTPITLAGPNGEPVLGWAHSNKTVTDGAGNVIEKPVLYTKPAAVKFSYQAFRSPSSGKQILVGVGSDGSVVDAATKQPLSDADRQAFLASVQAKEKQPGEMTQGESARLSAQQRIKLAGIEAEKAKAYGQVQNFENSFTPQADGTYRSKTGEVVTSQQLNAIIQPMKQQVENSYTAQRNALLGQNAQPFQYGQASNPASQQTQELPMGKGQKLTDVAIAKQFLDAAGGDKAKAQQLATLHGWKF